MANDKFTIKEALNYGWTSFKNHAGFFIGLMIIVALAVWLPTLLVNQLLGPQGLGHAFGMIIVRLIGVVFGLVTSRLALNIYDRDETTIPSMGTLLSPFLPYLFGRILYVLIVLGGSLLLIIPGMIWAYMFMYVGLIVIDKGLGPIEALNDSKVITYGYKWDLFFFSMVLVLVNVAGLLCFVVGLLVTAPVSVMASTYVYRRLSPAQTV